MTNRPLIATDFDDGLACRISWAELRTYGGDVLHISVGPGPGTHRGDGDLYWPNEHNRRAQR